jgi:flagellar hook-associated protein 3 FlgL
VEKNLTNLQTNTNVADQAISSALLLADQAASLGAQGANSATTTLTRHQLALQVQSALGQVVSLSQTSIAGRYVFSGDADQNPSYQFDPTGPNGVIRLSTAQNTSQIQDPNGGLISTGLTAGQIFDPRNPDDTPSSNNLFASLNSLYQALNNDDTAGISAAITSIQQASTYVNTQQGFYAALQNRVTQGLGVASNLMLSLTSQIADINATDISEAAIQLTAGVTQYQAALAARSQVPHTSLFDYLK